MLWDSWISRWQETLEACQRLGGDARELIVREPATEAEVLAVEQKLSVSLPASFRKVLTQFSSSVDFYWQLPEEFKLPHELREVFSGECRWSLSRLVDIEEGCQMWLKHGFPDPNDSYDAVWHDVLGFHEVANGDLLAFDLTIPSHPVVYLSHDDGDGHGYQLGANFADFIDRLTRLGCIGSEDWQMMPFLASPTSLLGPDCENARLWRDIFGLKFSK